MSFNIKRWWNREQSKLVCLGGKTGIGWGGGRNKVKGTGLGNGMRGRIGGESSARWNNGSTEFVGPECQIITDWLRKQNKTKQKKLGMKEEWKETECVDR